MVMVGDLAGEGERTIQFTEDVLYNGTSEAYKLF